VDCAKPKETRYDVTYKDDDVTYKDDDVTCGLCQAKGDEVCLV